MVSKEGIKTDPDKIQALKDWPVPTNVNDLRKFLGFASYFRRFVPGFSQIAKPLHSLLKNIPKKKSKQKPRKCESIDPEIPFIWKSEQQNAFDTLIKLLSSAPVLAFADFSKPFIVHTNASADGISGILYQEQD